jgi:hypothetical protein
MKKRTLSNLLKNKARSYSAQAAITSAVIHLLLILFAGSIVAVHYVQKQNAQLIAGTESRPRLERKKLQAPAKVEQLQKKALTSKLVSKKVSFASPEFVLPDTGKISSLKTQKSLLPGTDAGRILRNLSRTPGIGPSRINFFGIRAEGEKVCFLIDASAAMLESGTGGLETFEYIKSELEKIVSEMKPAMLFNLIFYDQQRVFMFRPHLVPATKAIAGELGEWVRAVNSNPGQPGLNPDQHNYAAPGIYETAVGTDAQGWLLAMQSAMEQQPDAIMTLGSGWGHHHISSEKATRLLDYALWEMLVGNLISGAPVLDPDRKLRNDLLKEASSAIQKDEKSRLAKAAPAGFVRDVAQYVEYSRDQILDHLEAVYSETYSVRGLSRPDVHFVCLADAGNQVVAGGTLNHLRALTSRYNGQFDFMRRDAGQIAEAKNNSLQPTESHFGTEEETPVVSPVTFFGVPGEGSRVAFILDASKEMLTDETGGDFSYSFIKKQIAESAAGLQSGTQFNVFLYNDRQLALFRPGMVPAEAGVIEELNAWLESANKDRLQQGIPEALATAVPIKDYGTVIGSDASGWLLALQTAIEQQADVVWVAGAGWGSPTISRDKGRKLLDFSVWDTWGGGSSGSGGTVVETDEEGAETVTSASGGAALGTITSLKQDKQQRDALLKESLKAIGQEDQLRKAKGLPQPFVRDILSYLRYTAPQIGEHLSAVVREQSEIPAIHFVCLVPAESRPAAETTRHLRKLTADYGGSLVLFRGAGSLGEIKNLNRNLELADSPPESP